MRIPEPFNSFRIIALENPALFDATPEELRILDVAVVEPTRELPDGDLIVVFSEDTHLDERRQRSFDVTRRIPAAVWFAQALTTALLELISSEFVVVLDSDLYQCRYPFRSAFNPEDRCWKTPSHDVSRQSLFEVRY